MLKWMRASCPEEIRPETSEGVTALSQKDYADIRNRGWLDS